MTLSVDTHERLPWQILRLSAVAFSVNFVWEMVQAPFYTPMGTFWAATLRCAQASVGDAAIVCALWAGGAIAFRSSAWLRHAGAMELAGVAVVGGAIGIAMESAALDAGRWTYGRYMPVVPGLRVGLIPVLQMMLLPPLILFAHARSIRSRHHKS